MTSDARLGECCCCVPLRQGVLLITGVTIVFSLIALVGLFTDSVTVLAGGFSPMSKVINGVLGASGLVFATVGGLGAYDATPAYVAAFFYFLVAQVVVGCVIYTMDMVELRECETWVSGVQQHVNYNPSMDEIAQSGECARTRVEYSVWWLLMFLLRCYFTFEVWRYSRAVERTGHYNIGFAKDSQLPPVFLAAGGEQPLSAPIASGQPQYGATESTGQPRAVARTMPPGYYGNGSR